MANAIRMRFKSYTCNLRWGEFTIQDLTLMTYEKTGVRSCNQSYVALQELTPLCLRTPQNARRRLILRYMQKTKMGKL